MALNFPSGYEHEQTWTDPSNSVTYVYDVYKNSWTAGTAIGGGGASVIIGEGEPSGSNNGDMWFQPSTEKLHVYVSGTWYVTGIPMDQWSDIGDLT